MKKATFFAFLVLSSNAFTQIKPSTSKMLGQTSNSIENIQNRLKEAGYKSSGIYPANNLHQINKNETLKPNTLIQLNDSIYWWRWDTLKIGWTFFNKTINIVYDANNNEKSDLQKEWKGNAWVNLAKNTYTYNANKKLLTQLYETWNGSSWINNSKISFTYDANNNLTLDLSQTWNISSWENAFKDIYTYDVNNINTSSIIQYWNVSTWVNLGKSTFTHNANKNITSETDQTWNGSSWINTTQFILIYDANNNLTSELQQNWDGGSWVNYSLYTYTYNANNKVINLLLQSWNGSAWENSETYTSIYDANNDAIRELVQQWNGSAWENAYIYLMTYDANHFIKSRSDKYINNAGTQIFDGDSTHYYFHTVVSGNNDLNVQNENIIVFPNPNSGMFSISNNTDIRAIEIYNLLGERIYSNYKFNQRLSNEIDISDQNKGIYLVKIYNGSKIVTRKIIIQ